MHDVTASAPDISVVIPCYNAAKWIGRAIDSVLAQKGVSVEVIVVDDGSTDGSLELLRVYGDYIRWETGSNRGACAARNRGLKLASHEFVLFLDADDFLSGDFLLGAYNVAHGSQVDCVLGQVANQSEARGPAGRKLPRVRGPNEFLSDWISGCYVPPCGVLWRSNFVKSIGGWNEELNRNQDGELMFRAVLNDVRLETSSIGYAVYWSHSGNRISTTLNSDTLRQAFRTVAALSIRKIGDKSQHSELVAAISAYTHTIERQAIMLDDRELHKEIEDYRREHRFPRLEGTTGHIVLTTLLGLRLKEKLARKLRELNAK